MKKINENTKITLTIGQLKRLVVTEAKRFKSGKSEFPNYDNDMADRASKPEKDSGFMGIDDFINLETKGDNSWYADDEWAEKFRSWVSDKHPEFLEDEWYCWDWSEIRDEFNAEQGISYDDDEEEKQDQYFKVQYNVSDCAIIVWDANTNKFRVAQMDDDLDSNIKDDIRRVRNISYFYDTTPNALLDILDHHLGSLGYDIYPMSTEDALAKLED